ncbi:MAG: pyridoxamine 5'-phosphate oxidase family protein [Halobacteriales archaeon]|nr:pyridoxamine 5'-phosphate oxidase family protein [Halobacteriales archaeon]
MGDAPVTEMTADERDTFLGTGGMGVMSLSTAEEEPPHSIPVSYGYDSVETNFYFRLAVAPDSAKGTLADRLVSFVVFGETDAVWRSIVATGRLESTTDAAIANETLQGLERVEIPLVDFFDKPVRDVEFEFYRLDPQAISGRMA